MIRAVAWDIDGTLIDSEPAHQAALVRVSARYGVALAADDPRFVGVAMEQVFDRLAPLYPPSLSRRVWLDEIVEAYIASAPTL